MIYDHKLGCFVTGIIVYNYSVTYDIEYNIKTQRLCLFVGESILKSSADLRWVRRVVWEARSQWRDIGRAFELSEGTICAIHEDTDGESLHMVIKLWMELGKATVNTLLEALEDEVVSRCDIAQEIRDQLRIKGCCFYCDTCGFSILLHGAGIRIVYIAYSCWKKIMIFCHMHACTQMFNLQRLLQVVILCAS